MSHCERNLFYIPHYDIFFDGTFHSIFYLLSRGGKHFLGRTSSSVYFQIFGDIIVTFSILKMKVLQPFYLDLLLPALQPRGLDTN